MSQTGEQVDSIPQEAFEQSYFLTRLSQGYL